MKWHLKLFLYHYTPIITHWQQMRQNPLDNVFIERFWRSLKQEKIYMIILNTVKEVKNAITNYMGFYNNKRMHQALEYLTPEQVHFKKNIV